MKAEYDSHADAIQIDFVDEYKVDREALIDDRNHCTVSVNEGRAVGLQVLYLAKSPSEGRDALAKAAAEFDLDLRALEAAVASALAAPDQEVRIELIGAPKV